MASKDDLKVLKRSEDKQILDKNKIADSIFLAAQDVGGTDRKLSVKLAGQVIKKLKKQYGRIGEVASVEIGDMVEKVLLENEHYKTAKAYILNRDKKRKIEAQKRALGVKDEVGLGLNGLIVFKEKYVRKDEEGDPVESVKGVFERVVKEVSQVEDEDSEVWKEKFLEMMVELRFLPGGRTLANAGTSNQLANCFVMPMPDDIEGIFESVKESSILKKYGGAVGFNFGHIRPKGDQVSTTSGAAAGPVALMKLINDASDIYLQAGKRRSGNMVTLPVSHPDVMEFIHCKEQREDLPHINYSLSVTSKFMEAVEKDEDWEFINPRNGEMLGKQSARGILEEAARMAWKTGDPGLIFIDRINKDNPTPHVGPLETVNLCGEQPLLSYEACNLGSVNLAAHVVEGEVDWEELEKTVRVVVRFLDDAISVCDYPLNKVGAMVRANRKIGLGVMGWADMLVKLGVAYDSEKGRGLAEKVMSFIQEKAWEESEELGKKRGSFPNFEGSIWEERGYESFRNATVTTIAPTGSISMVAGCSGGIEPHFALAYYRKSMDQYDLPEVNQDLVREIKYANGLYSEELMDEIAAKGSIQEIEELPDSLKKVYITSMDIEPKDHVRMLAVFQKYTDNAVSKTINMPKSSNIEDVMDVFLLAEELGCKGITVYRDGSRNEQVLKVGKGVERGVPVRSGSSLSPESAENDTRDVDSVSRVSNACPQCGGKLAIEEGCKKCYGCGFSVCG